MAAVTVFVDDAVSGGLPPLCVVTGRPTDDGLVIRHRIGGLSSAALLLLFLGPVGLVVLLVLAAWNRGETLTVTVPFHDDEYQRYRRARRSQFGLMAVGLAAFPFAFAFQGFGQGPLWIVLAAGCLVAAALIGALARHRQPAIDLDATRRWVTLRRVDPAFAAAAAAQSRARSDSRESASAADLSGR